MTVEVLIRESFEPDAKVLGKVVWLEHPQSPSMFTLAAGYNFCSVTGEERILEYAYIPDALYKINVWN